MNEPRKNSKAQKTRDHLLHTSLKLMEKNGYQNTTVRDICAEANISIGTFYSYFPSKNDLFLDIYGQADDYFTDTVSVNITGHTAKEKIIDFFRFYARLNIDSGIELVRILYNPDNSWFSRTRPMQQVLEKIVSEGMASGELEGDISPSEAVDFFFISVRGFCYNWCILNGEYDLEAELVKFVTRVLRAF